MAKVVKVKGSKKAKPHTRVVKKSKKPMGLGAMRRKSQEDKYGKPSNGFDDATAGSNGFGGNPKKKFGKKKC